MEKSEREFWKRTNAVKVRYCCLRCGAPWEIGFDALTVVVANAASAGCHAVVPGMPA